MAGGSVRTGMMLWLRSLCFNLLFWCWTVTLGIVAVPVLPFAAVVRHVPNLWIDGTLWLLRICCGLRISVEGLHHLPAIPCIIACKHQSALDTLVLWRVLGGPAFILKRQLLHIPVFGWYLARMKPIAIERSNPPAALQAIGKQAEKKIQEGRHIVIFPEGTRTRPGQQVRYRTGGISLLYRTLGVPVVPVALNTGVFWGRNAFCKRAGVARFKCLPQLCAGMDEQVFLEQLRSAIENASQTLAMGAADE